MEAFTAAMLVVVLAELGIRHSFWQLPLRQNIVGRQ